MFKRYIFIIVIGIFFIADVCAQYNVIKGSIKDNHSDEPIPFAAVSIPKKGTGLLADSAGNFILQISDIKKGDTLTVQYIGYASVSVPIPESNEDTIRMEFRLERSSIDKNVVIKSKYGKGWVLWRKIVRNKPLNDRYRFDNFGYELYNKLEIDLNRINPDRFKNFRLFRPF
jgi:hypothetical protein